MAVTASVSRADGSTFPMMPQSPSRTVRAELWFGPFAGPILRVLKFGASSPAAWARARGLGPRFSRTADLPIQ